MLLFLDMDKKHRSLKKSLFSNVDSFEEIGQTNFLKFLEILIFSKICAKNTMYFQSSICSISVRYVDIKKSYGQKTIFA